jgi:NAD-dependent dihydropyrimidine dehydrogenase PreA subunit
MAKRINVVLSQGQSHNPAKRKLEEDIVGGLLLEAGIDITVISHLYDLKSDSSGLLALQGLSQDFIVLSWLFPRAAHWTLDRNGVRGHMGTTLFDEESDDDDEETAETPDEDGQKHRIIDERPLPNRKIFHLDLRAKKTAAEYIEEVKRIAQEQSTQVVQLTDWVSGEPKPEQMQRFLNPFNDTALGDKPSSANNESQPDNVVTSSSGEAQRIEEKQARRWYPVIDFSRCTNCMECIDFCLFGVYGIDQSETILVEQPDNCRKGCPACSRVCPENAIIFPQHKTPVIAGAPGGEAGLKIDLSQLFGAPDAQDVAARERDEQLLLAGRKPVGVTEIIPKRQTDKENEPKDELDDLIDELDDLDL